jgi:hypothetical protein
MIFKKIAKKSPKTGEKILGLIRNKAKLCKNLIVTMSFEKNANFFPPKIVEIAEKL